MRIASLAKLKELINRNLEKLIVLVGFVLVASISFGLGRSSVPKVSGSSGQTQVNYSSNTAQTQSTNTLACQGQIKGSASYLYHLPGGAFYDKTTSPIACFDTEAQAKAAGFRKSSR